MNSMVPTPPVGTRDGNWVWDGSRWVCAPDCGNGNGSSPPLGPPVFSGPTSQPPWYPGANGGISFGASAPANPVRGHLWWDGNQLNLFDGAGWVSVSGGGVTPPSVSPPTNPVPGQQWFNGSTLMVWDGHAWVPVSTTKSYIQATPPPAPNPGDTWWDGVQMRIWDGTAWELVGPGATVGPVPTSTIEFAMTVTTPLTVGTPGPWTIIPFNNTPVLDALNGWNASTHKYQPNRSGIYMFVCRGWFNAAGGVALLKNDPGSFDNSLSTSDIMVGVTYQAAGPGWTTFTGVTQLNGTSDYVRMWALSASGTLVAMGSNPCFIATALP